MITETPLDKILMRTAGWMLAALWIVPLAYALWSAFHPAAFEARFDLTAPLTLENFVTAWGKAPFARYFLNTIFLVTMVLTMQLVLCTLAAFAFARLEFPGKSLLFGLVLVQLLIMPDILLVENYRTMFRLGLVDTIPWRSSCALLVAFARACHLPATAGPRSVSAPSPIPGRTGREATAAGGGLFARRTARLLTGTMWPARNNAAKGEWRGALSSRRVSVTTTGYNSLLWPGLSVHQLVEIAAR